MKKWIVSNAILLVAIATMAQSPDLGQPPYIAQSSTLLIRFYPGAKTGKVFLVGKKAADLDLNKQAKLISVTLFNQGRREELKMSRDGSAYLLEPTKPFPPKYELQLETELHGELQQMQIQVDGKP